MKSHSTEDSTIVELEESLKVNSPETSIQLEKLSDVWLEVETKSNLVFEATDEYHEKLFDAMVLHHSGRSTKRDWIPFIGIFSRDLRRRIPFYFSDLYMGIHFKCLVSVIFMFFCSIAPALTFGVHLEEITHGIFGVTEVLFATSLFGMIFALVAGQPLVIVGVTGPVVIFISTVYNLSKKFHLPFLQWYCVIGFWSGLMHILLAIFNVSNLVKYVTRFSDEVFAVLIGVIFIQDAITALVEYFKSNTMDVALLCFIVAVGSFYVSYSLKYARSWDYFPNIVRKVLADLAVPIGVAIFTGVIYIPKIRDVEIPLLAVPNGFKPTDNRQWVVRYTGDGYLPLWAYFAAILPALILTSLFFFDHSVSSLLSQKTEFKLKKGSAFHWDIFIIGINMIIASVIGVPFTTGLLPQAPLHVLSLATVKDIEDNGRKTEVIVKVRENRITGFIQSLLILIFALFGQKVLRVIPHAATTGLFLFMGVTGFDGIQFADRVKLFFRHNSSYSHFPHSFLSKIPLFHIVIYTCIQGICWAVIYAITWTPAAIAFPVLILVLVPLRKLILPLLYSKLQLYYLDNHESGKIEEYDSGKEQTKKLIDFLFVYWDSGYQFGNQCISRTKRLIKREY